MTEALDRCLACAVYAHPLPRIIKAYKDAGERRLAPYLAELLYDTALHAQVVAPDRYGGVLSGADAVVFVPATAAAFRRRGFDHMEAIARPFCELSGVPLLDALVKYGHGDQRELGRDERREHARGMYETVEDVRGRRRIAEIVRTLSQRGKLVLAILHDMDFVAECFERVIVMAQGRVVAEGTPRRVFSDAEALQAARLDPPHVTQLCTRLGYEGVFLTVEEFLHACGRD